MIKSDSVTRRPQKYEKVYEVYFSLVHHSKDSQSADDELQL